MTSSVMPWIKVYTEALDDPKLGRLTDAQKWRFVSLCLLAGECDQEGDLVNGSEPLTEDDIAWRLRVPYDELCADLAALRRIGVVNHDGEVWSVTHFADRQGRPQHEKRADWRDSQQRHRDKSSDVIDDSCMSHASRQDKTRQEQTRQDKDTDNNRQEGAGAPVVVADVPLLSLLAAIGMAGTNLERLSQGDDGRVRRLLAYAGENGLGAGWIISEYDAGRDAPKVKKRRRNGNGRHDDETSEGRKRFLTPGVMG